FRRGLGRGLRRRRLRRRTRRLGGGPRRRRLPVARSAAPGEDADGDERGTAERLSGPHGVTPFRGPGRAASTPHLVPPAQPLPAGAERVPARHLDSVAIAFGRPAPPLGCHPLATWAARICGDPAFLRTSMT